MQGRAWSHADLRRVGWQPAPCLGWSGDSRLVVALAARFHSSLSLDALAARLVAVSRHPEIRVWAVTRQEWRPMALDQTDCMSYARMAIFRAGFEKSEPGSQTMSGKHGDYTASIRCLSEQRIVFFIMAGP